MELNAPSPLGRQVPSLKRARRASHRAVALLLLAALAGGTPTARAGLRQRLEQRAQTRMAERAPGQIDFSYGKDALQSIALWKAAGPAGARPAPLIIFVHGGGWKHGDVMTATGAAKVSHFTGLGYAFASVNYRLVPAATVEQQAQDVASAVARLRADAVRYGIDPARIVLMGHSAGAHLVGLVGTDPRYLRDAGLTFQDIKGVISIDGAAYDVATQMRAGGRFVQNMYGEAFGSDPARQARLSPTRQAGTPNAPAFLILHVQRADGTAQAKDLEAALRASGTRVERREFSGQGLRGHMEINRRLGDADYPATSVVDHWLAARFAAR